MGDDFVGPATTVGAVVGRQIGTGHEAVVMVDAGEGAISFQIAVTRDGRGGNMGRAALAVSEGERLVQVVEDALSIAQSRLPEQAPVAEHANLRERPAKARRRIPRREAEGCGFQIWEYTVSHKQLLLRHPAAGEGARNVDLVFDGVEYLELPASVRDLTLAAPEPGEIERVERALGRSVPAQRVFVLGRASGAGAGL